MRLIEGENYNFVLKNQFQMPGTDQIYWVMQDLFGGKHLLPAKFYLSYGFENGAVIKCRLDKINCTGKLFFEPFHPYYDEGKTYDFGYIGIETGVDLIGQKRCFLKLKDRFGNEFSVLKDLLIEKEKYPTGIISATVDRVRKGKLLLMNKEVVAQNFDLKTGKVDEFEIISKIILKNNKEKYILKDRLRERHAISAKHFRKYNLKVGKKINAIVKEFDSRGLFFIEPLHPVYELGSSYIFRVVDTGKAYLPDRTEMLAITYSDVFDNENTVIVPTEYGKLISQNEIRGKVVDLYKSRVIIEIET